MPIIIPDNLPYTPPGIECLRLGARRGGIGIGCCAIDVIQGFNNDPDALCPQQPHFDGDSWSPSMDRDGLQKCVGGPGLTNEDVFLSHLTHGSFTLDPEPDHGFIVTLTQDQCNSVTGQKWLKILKREGFEWIGAVSNSVYGGLHPNHVFALFRSTNESMEDSEIEFLKTPPSAWSQLPAPEETPAERYQYLLSIAGSAHTLLEDEPKPTEAPEKATESLAEATDFHKPLNIGSGFSYLGGTASSEF